jgi:FkbM family methyltransferase
MHNNNLLSYYETLRPQRIADDKRQPVDGVIALLGENMATAIEYYRVRNEKLPPFSIIDRESSGWFMWRSLAVRECVTLLPLENFIKTSEKLHVFARPMQTQYGSGCLLPTVESLIAKGICGGYYLDAVSCKYIPPRPPEKDYLERNFSKIERIWNALADEASRATYMATVKALVTGDMGYLPLSEYRQYHHPLVKAEAGDTVFEGGVCDGSTTLEFAAQVGLRGHVYAFEPMPDNYERSYAVCRAYSNITVEALGLWKNQSSMRISCEDSSSRILYGGEETQSAAVSCRLVSLDAYVAEKNLHCDMLKLDVEGAEPEVLQGAYVTLQRCRPKLQLSIYHSPWTQLVDIPLWVMDNLPDYRLYAGHHSAWFPETMLYGIAAEKAAGYPGCSGKEG